MCWGVHMQRMDERMTRACATRAHICADVVPTVVRRRSHGAVKLKVRVARGVHTGSCVGVQVHGAAVGRAGGGAAVGRAGEGAAVGRAGGDAVHVQAPRCGARARAAAGASRRIALYDTLVSVLGSSGHRGFGASGFHSI